MADDPFDVLETIFECLKQMEGALLGIKQLQPFIGDGVEKEMLQELIEKAETQIAEIKRRVIQ